MRYRNTLLGISIVVPLLLVISILWRDSERQYVAMTNLGHRLAVLRQSVLDGRQVSQKHRPSWEMAWKPMVTAMQFEARHALAGTQGFHLSRPMHEQLSRFSEKDIDDETGFKDLLSRLNLSEAVFVARVPLVFSADEQRYSLSTVAVFRKEISAMLSSETAYSDWLSPILYQQQLLDKSTTCKTLMEIKAFQTYSDRLKSKCAAKKNKWAVCSGENAPITRQMKELQMTLESNLKKFQSRWSVENVNDLCADF